MGIIRNIIDWVDSKMDEAFEEEDPKKALRKTCASGFVEGFMDGLVIYGAICWTKSVLCAITGGRSKK